MWSVLENIPWDVGSNVYSFVFERNILKYLLGRFGLSSQVDPTILSSFCQDEMSVGESGVMKSPINNV